MEILYEDEWMVVVNKPAGLLSIPDRFDPEKPNLYHQLMDKYQEIVTVHRLDRETSGVLCFARHAEAHRHLSMQFEHREVQKLYLALVDGVPHPPEGIIEKGLAKHPTQAGKMIISAKGKMAVTHYRVLETFRSFSWLEADIKTGRTHQIRVHFAGIGHPLAVDPLYGRREAFLLSEIKGRKYHQGKDQEERPLLSRTSLHASKLTLRHPVSEELLTIEAPLPKDLRATLNQIRRWNQ